MGVGEGNDFADFGIFKALECAFGVEHVYVKANGVLFAFQKFVNYRGFVFVQKVIFRLQTMFFFFVFVKIISYVVVAGEKIAVALLNALQHRNQLDHGRVKVFSTDLHAVEEGQNLHGRGQCFGKFKTVHHDGNYVFLVFYGVFDFQS